MRRASSPRISVSLLTGFLGSGKTTILNSLMQRPELNRTLVIINEFGEIGVDHDLVAQSSDEVVVEMSSGCLCCTIRGDLAKTLREAPGRFARGGERWFDRVIIETTGLADPAPILHTLINDPSVARQYRLDGVITVVDAVNGTNTLERQVESVKQAAVADRLLVTKTDIAEPAVVNELQSRLGALNPIAPQIIVQNGAVDPEVVLDAGEYDPSTKSTDAQNWLKAEIFEAGGHGHEAGDHRHHGHDHHHDHDHDDVNRHDEHIQAFCLTLDEPIHSAAFEIWLEGLLLFRGEDFLRIKGILNVVGTDGPTIIHGVQHVMHPPITLETWPSEDRRSRIVFITRDIDEAVMRTSLEALNGAERRQPGSLAAERSR